MSTLKLDTLSNKAGTASVPSDTIVSGTAKAWVNFNGTGTVAIRRSFNVSSITDNGTGSYNVNFTTAMVDANYAVVVTAGDTSGSTCLFQSPFNTAPTTTSAQVLVTNSVFTATDRNFMQVAIFS
jgi:hypothetical protein